jgi:hypothetical protein
MDTVVCDCCETVTNRCAFCDSDELVWSSVVRDYRCGDCGLWSDGKDN